MVLYISPISESGLDTDKTREELARWEERLSLHTNRAQFAEFLAEA
jgi:hypothetical protein